nr:hypothetical protein [Klebsiella michiganensis]UGK55322.1 Hypothetical protein [Raoultella ornithinolytica]UMW96343.1 hypothetical protein [Raoultella ornithinolytica]
MLIYYLKNCNQEKKCPTTATRRDWLLLSGGVIAGHIDTDSLLV